MTGRVGGRCRAATTGRETAGRTPSSLCPAVVVGRNVRASGHGAAAVTGAEINQPAAR
jgi:hypothetical protein